MSHFSYNSMTDITDIFKAMFPDSVIAQKMSCGSKKMTFLICCGTAPYFKQLIMAYLRDAPGVVILFLSFYTLDYSRSRWNLSCAISRKSIMQVSPFTISWPHTCRRHQEIIDEGTQDLYIKKLSKFLWMDSNSSRRNCRRYSRFLH